MDIDIRKPSISPADVARWLPRFSSKGIRLAPWFLLPWVIGCSDEPRSLHYPVSGRVTVDGRPLEEGAISFLPSRSGPSASAPIRAGTFCLDRTDGPGNGPYRVEIVSIRPTGKRIESPDVPGVTIEETYNVIPTRYNSRSELLVSVEPDGPNAYQFDITSKEPRLRARRRR
jgi:hypothetical protein